MIKYLINFFIPNYYWKIFKVEHAYWELTDRGYNPPMITKKPCVYEIWYSKDFGEYKLRMYGHKPRLHPYYELVVDTLYQLNS